MAELRGVVDMGERLTDRAVRALPIPASGSKITFDGEAAAIIKNEMREDALAGKDTEVLGKRLIDALGLTGQRFKQAVRLERDEDILLGRFERCRPRHFIDRHRER